MNQCIKPQPSKPDRVPFQTILYIKVLCYNSILKFMVILRNHSQNVKI